MDFLVFFHPTHIIGPKKLFMIIKTQLITSKEFIILGLTRKLK
jgi:hypothetical protein